VLQSQATNRYDMQKKILKVLIFMYVLGNKIIRLILIHENVIINSI